MIRTPRPLAQCGHFSGLLLVVALAGAVTGCYTLIQHPHSASPVSARNDDICYSCHTSEEGQDLDLYPWGDYYGHSTSPWINYYASPWWYDSRWQWNGPSSGGSGAGSGSGTAEEASHDRYGWGRHPRSTPALSDSLRPRETSFPPAPIVSSPSVAPLPPGTPAGQGSSSGTSNTSGDKEKKKEKKEPERRTLRR